MEKCNRIGTDWAKGTVRPRVAFVGNQINEFEGDKYRPYEKSLEELKKLADSMEFDLLAESGPVKTLEQAENLMAGLDGDDIDFVLLQASTFCSGEMILPLINHDLPLGLWALPEPADKGWMHLNSFCGVNLASSIRRYYLKNDRPVKFFWGHACDDFLQKALKVTVGACRAIRALAGAKLAVVGKGAPGFYDLNVNESTITERLGTTIESINLDFVIASAKTTTADDVNNRISELKKQIDFADYHADQIERSVRVELALKRICSEKGIDILALDCWPEFQLDYNVMVCSAVGSLNSSGIVTACEADIESALSMFVLSQLAAGPSTLMDLSTLSTQEDALLLWHCGPAPACYADKNGVRFGKTLCKDAYGLGSPATVLGPGNYMVFSEGPYTIMRFTADAGRMLAITGNICKNNLPVYDGSMGWMTELELNGEKVSALDVANTIVTTGFQHHFPLVKGNFAAEVSELARWLDVKQLRTVRYRHYL